jgi:predicted nucleic acid-binding protein
VTAFVVDASVAAKWYLEESGTDKARLLLDERYTLHAPAFLRVEVDNVFLKWVRRGAMSVEVAELARHSLRNARINWRLDTETLDDAFRWAVTLRRSIYDCMYLSLAAQMGVPMVTADDRLHNAIAEEQKRLGRQLVLSLSEVA